MSAEDKTEQPSAHKLSQARKKGQVFKSQELNFALSILASVVLLNSLIKPLMTQFITLTGTTISGGNILQSGNIYSILNNYILLTFKLVAPVLGCCLGVALLANVLQIGFLFTTQTLTFNWSRLYQVEGFKKIYSRRAVFELCKNLAKIVLVFFIVLNFFKKNIMGVPFCFNEPLLSSFHSYAHSVYTLGIRIGLFFFILAIFDYMYQRYEYHQNMRMSKHELKQEYKELEGDPFLKQRQQQIRQKLSRSRMMENVKKAKVVITNPTHFACALMYNEELEAPRLVAKGKNLIAKNIIKVAKEHNIPVVENKTLARSLYAHVEIEEIIPPQLYAAVAEVILFVMQLEEEE